MASYGTMVSSNRSAEPWQGEKGPGSDVSEASAKRAPTLSYYPTCFQRKLLAFLRATRSY